MKSWDDVKMFEKVEKGDGLIFVCEDKKLKEEQKAQ